MPKDCCNKCTKCTRNKCKCGGCKKKPCCKPCADCKPWKEKRCKKCRAKPEYRTLDGSRNNRIHPRWGKADTELLRLVKPPAYADGSSSLAQRTGPGEPNPRKVSNALVKTNGAEPNSLNLSDLVWMFGQFLDHEIDLTPDTSGEKAPIPVCVGDEQLPNGGEIPFTRSVFASGSDPRQQLNEISSYIDASNVYGSSQQRADWIRLRDGTGRLKTQCGPDGPLPPYNSGNLTVASLPGQNPKSMYCCGDIRATEVAPLTAMHTLWLREHNLTALELADLVPEWRGNDERLYQEARRIVAGKMQAITFNEFLPALLGGKSAIAPYAGYDDTVNAGIANVFSTALYRLGHSMVSETLRLESADGDISSVALMDIFFKPEFVKENGIESLLFGAMGQRQQTIDTHIVSALRSFLFGPPENGQMLDLAALNIQRGRDHGLPGYNAVRQAYGLPSKTIDEMTTKLDIRDGLKAMYNDNADNIDPWIGALAEDHVDANTAVGELLQTALLEQFLRLRDGDRFWFQNDPTLPGWRKREIARTRLSDIIVRNTNLTRKQVPKDVFRVSDAEDDCSSDSDCSSSSSDDDCSSYSSASEECCSKECCSKECCSKERCKKCEEYVCKCVDNGYGCCEKKCCKKRDSCCCRTNPTPVGFNKPGSWLVHRPRRTGCCEKFRPRPH